MDSFSKPASRSTIPKISRPTPSLSNQHQTPFYLQYLTGSTISCHDPLFNLELASEVFGYLNHRA